MRALAYITRGRLCGTTRARGYTTRGRICGETGELIFESNLPLAYSQIGLDSDPGNRTLVMNSVLFVPRSDMLIDDGTGFDSTENDCSNPIHRVLQPPLRTKC